MVFTLKKSTVTDTKTVTEIMIKKNRARHGGMERPDSHPKASEAAKQSDATRIGRAIIPEPIIPREKRMGPSCPKGARASAAARVVMLVGSATCRCDAATMAEMEMRQATTVPAWDSLTCAWAMPSGRPRRELVCHTMTSGVSKEPKTATTPMVYAWVISMLGMSTPFTTETTELLT